MAQTINVDVTPSLFQPTLYYHQGDIGREFAINISTKDGYEIPSGATVKIEATKPSGFGFSVEGTLSDNTVTFVSTEGMTDEWGRFPAQLEITSGNTVIYTANFLMVGEKDTHPASTVDGSQEDVIPQLTLLVERVENAAAAVLDTTTEVTTLPAGSQATYSFDEETNTATFGIPQGEAGAGSAGVVASAYSASKTYAVGDYAIHNSNLYRCTTAIATAESFTASHWTQVVLADDVTDLKSDINNLPIPSIRTNLMTGNYTKYAGKGWVRGAVDLVMGDYADYDIYKVAVKGGSSYIAGADYGITNRGALRFADASDAFLSALSNVDGYYGQPFTMPDNAVYAYFEVRAGQMPILSESEAYPYHDDFKYYIWDDVVAPRIEADIENNTSVLDYIMEDSFNLADSTKFTLGKYYTNTGGIGNNDSYFYTDYIPVTAGEKLCASATSRWMCCFDANKQVVTNSDNISPSGWTVPEGVHYIIITVGIANKDTLVVSKDVSIPYIPYNEHISYEAVSAFNTGNIYGKDGISKFADSLAANTAITFSEYPAGLAKGTSITGSAFFTSFDSIKVGAGDSSKSWFEVDNTSIKFYSSGALSNTVQHGLSITDYISFSLLVDNDCVAHFTIDTVGGSFSTEEGVSYGWNGFPYFESTHANTDVKVSVTNNDFKKSVWWFGDSYSGWAEYRILGALKSLGVTDGMLVDAVPGQRSYYDADTGAYADFSKAINFGIPKYLVWAIGMNDSDNNYKLFANSIAKFCELMHIEFIAVKAPSVPSVNNSNINSYIDAQGYRFVDWNKAVGATSSGVWYSGMLSSDNVHPSITGAEAMALRTLVDFVEITQYR